MNAMNTIEIHCIGRWVQRTDFEGLVNRLGEHHAADVWDIVVKHGSFQARNGLVYICSAIQTV